MDFPMCFFWYPLQRLATLVPFLVSAVFQGCGLILPVLYSTLILVLSSIFLTISSCQPEKNHEHLSSYQKCPPQPESPTCTKQTEMQKDDVGHIHGYTLTSLDSVSGSESASDQSSELDACQSQSPDYSSDWSISDEDDFIEISLSSGRYFDPKKQLQNFPEFSPEYILKQHGQMELFGDMWEMYEEDNLFEIDISMGSVKCC